MKLLVVVTPPSIYHYGLSCTELDMIKGGVMIANAGEKLLYFTNGIDVCVNAGTVPNISREYVKYQQNKGYIISANSKKFGVKKEKLVVGSNKIVEIGHKFLLCNEG